MFQLFVLVIMLNLFRIAEGKSVYPENELIKKTPITITTTPIIMVKETTNRLDIPQKSKRCKVIVLPKLNWLTPYSLAKSGHKFQHVKVCKDITGVTTAATTTATTLATTLATTAATKEEKTATVAEPVIETTISLATTSGEKTKNSTYENILLKEVCPIPYILLSSLEYTYHSINLWLKLSFLANL